MAINGLHYQVKKKVLNHHILQLAQLANKVKQIENLNSHKLSGKKMIRKEKVSYIKVNDSFESDSSSDE
jgi:hypothetical protein